MWCCLGRCWASMVWSLTRQRPRHNSICTATHQRPEGFAWGCVCAKLSLIGRCTEIRDIPPQRLKSVILRNGSQFALWNTSGAYWYVIEVISTQVVLIEAPSYRCIDPKTSGSSKIGPHRALSSLQVKLNLYHRLHELLPMGSFALKSSLACLE